MKKILFLAVAALSVFGVVANAQEQQEQKMPTPEEMAAKEADRLGELLKLEDWQIFRVDSTLQNDYAEWQAEMDKMQKARVDNYDLYVRVRDKWMDHIEVAYRKIFTEEQWAAYLKSGAAKQQKARAKRKAAMESNTAKTQGGGFPQGGPGMRPPKDGSVPPPPPGGAGARPPQGGPGFPGGKGFTEGEFSKGKRDSLNVAQPDSLKLQKPDQSGDSKKKNRKQ